MDFVAKHREAALELYRKRARMLKTGMGDSALLQKTERRMRVAIAGVIPTQREMRKPSDAASGFLTYSVRIVNEYDAMQLQAIYDEALCLLEEGGDVAEGVFDALTLYPPANIDWTFTRYREKPKLRVYLFRLWRSQGAALPAGLIDQAELQSQDVALQMGALYFAADNPHYGKEIFSPYYHPNRKAPLLDPSIAESTLVPAIWGGLVRGDSEAHIALRNAVELNVDLQVRHQLLRMLALVGTQEDLPVLLSYAKRDPEKGYPLLALLGLPVVVPYILQGLEAVNRLEAAYSAWLMLTNFVLPMRPRLMVVSDYDMTAQDAPASVDMEMIPDAAIARKWWEAQEPHWPQSTRRYAGVPATRENLSQATTECIGVAADTLMALLALNLQKPLGVAQGWECQRQAAIQKLLAGQTTASSSLQGVG
jgi:hypothetical protein